MNHDEKPQENENQADATEQRREDILEMGSVTTRNSKSAIHCLTVVGQVVIIDSE